VNGEMWSGDPAILACLNVRGRFRQVSTCTTAILNLRLSALSNAGDPAVITYMMLQAYFPNDLKKRLSYTLCEINFDPENLDAIEKHTAQMGKVAAQLDRRVHCSPI
jgi:hypothetical protein